MIEIQNISKKYTSTDGEIIAIGDVTFTAKRGEFISLIGPSGCGKTTLIKIIGNLLEPSSGKVTVEGKTPEKARIEGMFSFVFQNPVMLPWRTIVENVKLPQHVRNESSRNAMDLLHMVGLAGFENKYPDELSGGMQQRAALARSLTFDPDVLLMDEPFGAVDEFTRNELNFELLRVWQDIDVTVFFVTHSIAEAAFMSDRVIVLSKRPSKVALDLQIPFERPRKTEIKDSAEFQEIVKCLREKLN